MGFRFRRRIGLSKLFNINLSKSGLGFSFGVRGARIGINKNGLYTSVGIPGTGLYYYQKLKSNPFETKNEDDVILNEGLKFLEKNNYHKAAENFSRYLLKNPNHFGVTHLLGFCYFKLQKYNDAISLVDKIPKGDENYDEALAIKAFCYQDLGDNDTAEKLLKEALPLLQGLILKEAYFCMGEINEAKGDYKTASEWYKKFSSI